MHRAKTSWELAMRLGAMRQFCSAMLLSSILAATASAVAAQTPQEQRWCEGEDGATLAQRIDGCSWVIKAAHDKAEKLAEAFNARGVAYRLKGDLDRAIQDYSQAIKLNDKLAAAYNNRGVAYDRKGEYDRAISDYEQAIKLKPSPEPYFNRGNTYLAKGQYDHAIDDFNQALRLKAELRAGSRQSLLGAGRRWNPQAGACRLQPGDALVAEQCRNVQQPCFHFLENGPIRCGRVRLRHGIADRFEACFRPVWSWPSQIEERGPCWRC